MFLLMFLSLTLTVASPITVYAYGEMDAVTCAEFCEETGECGSEAAYFEVGDVPYFYTAITSIQVNHRWKYVVYRDGEELFSYAEDEIREVEDYWEISYIYGYVSSGDGEGAEVGVYEVYFYLDTGVGFEFYDLVRFYVGDNYGIHVIPQNNPAGEVKIMNLSSDTQVANLYAIRDGEVSIISSGELFPNEETTYLLDGSYEAIAVIDNGDNMAVAYMGNSGEYENVPENTATIDGARRLYFLEDEDTIHFQNWNDATALVSLADAQGDKILEFEIPGRTATEVAVSSLELEAGHLRVISDANTFVSVVKAGGSSAPVE
jgi:hypothetical protein